MRDLGGNVSSSVELGTSGAPRLAVRASIRDQVVTSLRSAILSGELMAGVTYSAPVLASRFGVSPTPVREAMLDLISEGLVFVVPNKGYRITETSAEELQELVAIRELLELPTVASIAETISPSQVLVLRRSATLLDEAIGSGDVSLTLERDRQFHRTVVGLSGNARLVEMLDRLWLQMHSGGPTSGRTAADWERASRDHAELLSAFESRDSQRARDIVSRHIRNAFQEHRDLQR